MNLISLTFRWCGRDRLLNLRSEWNSTGLDYSPKAQKWPFFSSFSRRLQRGIERVSFLNKAHTPITARAALSAAQWNDVTPIFKMSDASHVSSYDLSAWVRFLYRSSRLFSHRMTQTSQQRTREVWLQWGTATTPTHVGGVAGRSRMTMRLSSVRVDVSSGTIGKGSPEQWMCILLYEYIHVCMTIYVNVPGPPYSVLLYSEAILYLPGAILNPGSRSSIIPFHPICNISFVPYNYHSCINCTLAGSVLAWVSWRITFWPQRTRPNGCVTSVSLPSTYPLSGWYQLNHEACINKPQLVSPSVHAFQNKFSFLFCLILFFFTIIKRFQAVYIHNATRTHTWTLWCQFLRFGASSIHLISCPILLKCGCWDLGFAYTRNKC